MIKTLNRKRRIAVFSIVLSLLILSIIFETKYLFKYLNTSSTAEVVAKNTNDTYSYSHNDEVLNLNLAHNQLEVTNEENPTILFGSDYQGDDRYESAHKIFYQLKDAVNPNLFVMCGDYQVGSADKFRYSEDGISELHNIYSTYLDGSTPQIYVQGNHDIMNAYGISKDGIYEANKYIIYVINRDSFPNNQSENQENKQIVIETANRLASDLQKLVDNNVQKPVFIVSHVPLHYTTRNKGEDNAYSRYLIDILNDYGNRLDLIYLFGHNHSSNYDDYIGGSINYIGIGSELKVGGTNQSININFTYLNAGYVGYANNLITENSVKETSMTTITVNNSDLAIQKYTKYGQYYNKPIMIKLKNK